MSPFLVYEINPTRKKRYHKYIRKAIVEVCAHNPHVLISARKLNYTVWAEQINMFSYRCKIWPNWLWTTNQPTASQSGFCDKSVNFDCPRNAKPRNFKLNKACRWRRGWRRLISTAFSFAWRSKCAKLEQNGDLWPFNYVHSLRAEFDILKEMSVSIKRIIWQLSSGCIVITFQLNFKHNS